MSQITVGTVTATNTSQTVTGSGTTWLTTVSANDLFVAQSDGVMYVVGSVDSDTQITLASNYAGVTGSGLTYVIHVDFTAGGIPLMQSGDLETVAIYNYAVAALEGLPFGTASLVDTGTASNQVPLNSDLGTAAYTAITAYATSAQGALADSSLQNTISDKNYINNGAFAISQENGFGVISVPASLGANYGADEFFTSSSFAGPPQTLVVDVDTTGTLRGSNSYKVLVTTVAGDMSANQLASIVTKIEANDIFHLNSKTVTVSFVVNTNRSGKLAISIINSAQNRSYVHEFDVVSGENDLSLSIALEATTIATKDTGRGLTIIIGGISESTQSTSTFDAWIGSYAHTSAAASLWGDTLSYIIEVTEVKFQEGSTATAFNRKSIREDLADCKRYFERRLIINDFENIGSGYAESTTQARAHLEYSEKRAAPSLSASDVTGFRVLQYSTDVDTTNIGFSDIGLKSVRVIATVASGLTNGQGLMVAGTTVGTYIDINARLP